MGRILSFAVAGLLLAGVHRTAEAQTLTGFASLPADTFAPGPTSGQFITTANGRVPPFVNQQPVQGFSSVLRAANGDFLAMSDNGFGAQVNSRDDVLRLYRLAPDFKTGNGGTGTIAVKSFIQLRDPDHKVNFEIVADLTNYPGTIIPVDAAIKQQRLLTGGDFDIESVREAHDGTLWFGDEFGPFLIHTDAAGVVLDEPIQLPGIQAPENPFFAAFNLPSSRGFEGMSISPNGKTLYPMLEGALIPSIDQTLRSIFEFDLGGKQYTGREWKYRVDAPGGAPNAIGDLTAVNKDLMLVIERDNFQGAAARFKKIFLVDLNEVGSDGTLVKHLVVDLLQIRDPNNLGGHGPTFTFPFQTIESVIPLNQREIGVLDDNNYPFSSARVANQPDPNEFLIIRLDRPLAQTAKDR